MVIAFELKSAFVRENEDIGKKYTCYGADVSVPANWTDPPEGTKNFALIKEQLLRTMQGHILAEAQLIGTYAR
jgi:phosphatidylethanolamine-binding protein (PEBP) family uncharacterized protein